MSRRKKFIFALFPLVFTASSLNAQQPLTLQQALAQAQNNALYRAKRQQAEALKGKLEQASKRPNPELESETDSNWDGSEHLVSLVVRQKWERGGKRDLRQQIVRSELTQAVLDAEDYMRILASEIRLAYLDLLRLQQRSKLQDTYMEKISAMIKLDEVRVREGEIPALNLDYLRAYLARRTVRRLTNQRKLALYRLNVSMGADVETDYTLQEDTTAPAPLPALEQALSFALKNRPDLKKQRAGVDAAQYAVDAENAARKRDWIVGLGYHRIRGSISGDDVVPRGLVQSIRDTSNLMELRLSIPVPVWDDNSGNVSAAITTRKVKETELAHSEAVVRSEVVTAYQQYQLAQNTAQMYRETFLPKLEENVKRLQALYELTGDGIRDWISDHNDLLDNALLAVEADFDLRKAVVELERQLGGFMQQAAQIR